MNTLPKEKRVQIVQALVEGCSMRAASRMAKVSVNTVSKLIVELGSACQRFHDANVVNVKAHRVQADEAWAFCYAKDKNLPDHMRNEPGVGSVWTWTALDSDSKLMINWHLGDRDAGDAHDFMQCLASRLANRVQLTTDGHGVYPSAVYDAFGGDIDYAQLVKHYGKPTGDESRYSPPVCIGCSIEERSGFPNKQAISTSHVERSNLTLRMGQRRYTRLTNAFSKKFLNMQCSVAMFFTYYNFCRVHKTLKETPAMRAGLSKHAWLIEELVGLLEDEEQDSIAAGKMKRGKYRVKGNQ